MNRFKSVLLAAVLMFIALPAFAQNQYSNQQTVNLALNVSESVTLSATPGTITFTPGPGGTATASGPISVVTTYNLGASRTSLLVGLWLGSSTAALSNGTTNIPSSDVLASNSSFTNSPCTGTNMSGNGSFPGSVAGAYCANYQVIGAGGGAGVNTSAVTLALAGLPTNLGPGSYTGTVVFQAVYW